MNIRVQSKFEQGGGTVSKGVPIRVTLKDGRVIEHETARGSILGSQANPWGMDNITGKFRDNVGLVLSQDRVNDAVRRWQDVTQVEDVEAAIRETLVG